MLPFKTLSESYINLIHAKVFYFLDIAVYFPYSYSIFDSPIETLSIRKIVIDRRFLVLYEIVDNTIEVLYFIDGRRSPDNMIIY